MLHKYGMGFYQWLESKNDLLSRTITINGIFYHITSKENVEQILRGGFDFSKVGKGFGFIDMGEPIGISLFLNKEDTKKFIKPGWVTLEVKIAPVKTLDARNIEKGGPWADPDVEPPGSWPGFLYYFFRFDDDEDVFSREIVTETLLKSGYGAVLHQAELRVLDLSRIQSVSVHLDFNPHLINNNPKAISKEYPK